MASQHKTGLSMGRGGGANNDICSIMEAVRGVNRASVIGGSSVLNQWIEHLWLICGTG